MHSLSIMHSTARFLSASNTCSKLELILKSGGQCASSRCRPELSATIWQCFEFNRASAVRTSLSIAFVIALALGYAVSVNIDLAGWEFWLKLLSLALELVQFLFVYAWLHIPWEYVPANREPVDGVPRGVRDNNNAFLALYKAICCASNGGKCSCWTRDAQLRAVCSGMGRVRYKRTWQPRGGCVYAGNREERSRRTRKAESGCICSRNCRKHSSLARSTRVACGCIDRRGVRSRGAYAAVIVEADP
ncbi:putative mitochondrial protein [Andalucia godoyi]|uniref:Putative mitochondrial protein n=1 Tax=Andalucia godoyi TaxID=505711 RepID=A0A8K0F4J1_ANDGO|nr:putative mitochondrial protein [Andalucia godoyi]|eukprot:ANDGO_08774.mRNA.1 putative mitochondrial protein